MNVPFGDLKLHYRSIKAEIDSAVARVLESGWYILGPELTAFEQSFAAFLGASYVVGCASGTEAIYLALVAAGVRQGDEVITVAHTAVPTISAISMAGALPVFVDVDRKTCLIDAKQVAAKITSRTKAIVPVHLYGQVADLELLLQLAHDNGIPLIEDVAQATGACHAGKKTGTLGSLGAFSFYPSKNLGAFGDGGAISTNSAELYEKLLRLRNYGQSKRYYHDEIGINSRLDEMQAAILAAQLPFVPKWNQRRIEIAARYTALLSDVVQTPFAQADHVYHLYVIQCAKRDALQAYLAERGIGTLIHYPVPAHLQKAYLHLGHERGDLPATELVADQILSLPMFPQLTDAQVDYVIGAVRQFVKDNPTAVTDSADQPQLSVATSPSKVVTG